MGKSQRVKGHAFERLIANDLKSIWADSKRGIQTQEGGVISDVVNPIYHFECSCGGQSIWAKWKQAQDDSKKNFKIPVVVKKRDREEPVVLLSYKAFKLMLLMMHGKGCKDEI